MSFEEFKKLNVWLERWGNFQSMENEYIKRLFPIVYELAMITVNEHTPKGKNWTYQRLCTGEIASDERRLNVLEHHFNRVKQSVMESEVLSTKDKKDHIMSELALLACFVISWLEVDWADK